MSQKISVVPQRGNSIVVFGPAPIDNTQTVHGPLAAGQAVTIEKGAFLDTDMIMIEIWDADDYAAAQQQAAASS